MLRGGGGGQQEILRYLQQMERRLERKIEEKFTELLYLPPEMHPFNVAKKHFEETAGEKKKKESTGSLEDELL